MTNKIQNVFAPQFVRTRNDTEEVLTLVVVTRGPFARANFHAHGLGAEYPYLVQVTLGDRLDGLYDLDGEPVDLGDDSKVERVASAPAEVIREICEVSWGPGVTVKSAHSESSPPATPLEVNALRTRDKLVQVRVSAAELAQIDACALDEGVGRAEWVRRAAKAWLRRKTDEE